MALLLILAACAVRPHTAHPEACRALGGDPVQAGALLQDCLDSVPQGGVLELPPRRIVLTAPIVIRRGITLRTAGSPNCVDGGACAVLALRANIWTAERPITVRGAGTVISHLVIEGGKADAARDDSMACRAVARPSRGALGIAAQNVTVVGTVLRDVACYSAAVVDEGADGLHFQDNAVLSNGTHDALQMWADGLTVIDGVDDVITGNLFRDNTDVQLVLGGCLRCRISANRFETSGSPGAANFTALLVHGWPASSGDFDGSAITGNTIDCGAARGCGFGLAVGGRGWYLSETSGGLIADNSITRAEIGINVDDATGPVTMRDNTVTQSGGPVRSHCGVQMAGPVNIALPSRRYVNATAGVAMAAADVTSLDFYGCLPGT